MQDVDRLPLYQYRDHLIHGEIRLLRVLDGDGSDRRIQGSLQSASLKNVKYLALSYCWGQTYQDDRHFTHTISVDGRLMLVTANIYSALKHFRKLARSGPHNLPSDLLWVDAICIDIKDVEERNRQVRQMPFIYANATGALIWLGDDFTIAERSVLEHARGQHDLDRNAWEQGAGEMVKRPWFDRRWTIVEMFFAKRAFVLSCESVVELQGAASREAIVETSSSEHDMWNAIARLQNNTFSRLQRLRQLQSEQHGSLALLDILSIVGNAACSDPHDNIFALLPATDSTWLDIDYSQPWAINTLYTRVAEHYIRGGRGLEVLAHATTRQSMFSAPSWVPDWRMRSIRDANLDCAPRNLSTELQDIEMMRIEGERLHVYGTVLSRSSSTHRLKEDSACMYCYVDRFFQIKQGKRRHQRLLICSWAKQDYYCLSLEQLHMRDEAEVHRLTGFLYKLPVSYPKEAFERSKSRITLV